MTLTLTAAATAGLLAPLQQQPASAQHAASANKWLRPPEQQEQQVQQEQPQSQHPETRSRRGQQQHRHAAAAVQQPPLPAVLTVLTVPAAAAPLPTRAATLNNKYIVCLDKPCGRLLHGFKVAKRPFVRRSALQIPRAAYANFLEVQGKALQRLHSRPHQAIIQMLDAIEPSTPGTDDADAHDGYLIFQPLYGDLTRPIAGPPIAGPPTVPPTPPPPPGGGLGGLAEGAQPDRGLAACAAAANAARDPARAHDAYADAHAAHAAASSRSPLSTDVDASTPTATNRTPPPPPPSPPPLHNAATLKRLFRKMLAAVAHCHSLGVCVRNIEPASFAWTNDACTDLRLTGLSHACVVALPRWQAAPNQGAKALFAVDVVAVADVFRFLLRRRQQYGSCGSSGCGVTAAADGRSPPAMAWMLELLKEMLVVPAAAAAAAAANKQSVYQMQMQQVEGSVGGIVIPKTASELLAGHWLQPGFGDTVATSEDSAAAVTAAAGNGAAYRYRTAGARAGSGAGASAGAGAGLMKPASADVNDDHVVPVFKESMPQNAATIKAGSTRTHARASLRTSTLPATFSSAGIQIGNQNRKRSRARNESDDTDAMPRPFKIKV